MSIYFSNALLSTMKTAFFFLTCLFVTLNLLLVSAAKDIVVDIDGQQLQTGTEYYILPVVRGNGGGLKLYSGRTSECPLDVVQEPNEVNRGLPVTFSPVNPDETSIQVSTDVNIKFSGATTCVQSTVWRLDTFNTTTGRAFVSTGGVLGSPGRSTLTNWFKIEKLDQTQPSNWYKLAFCPAVCDTCRPICGDLSVIIEKSGTRRLALSTNDKPFMVFFKKA